MKDFSGLFLTGEEIPDAYSRASGPFAHPPLAVAVPRHTEDVGRLVEWAAREGRTLIPRGAGTGMPGGNVGRGVILDLTTHFAHIEAPDVEAGTIRVGAGAVAADVAEAVASIGGHFPPLPSSAQWCTIGGMVANNAAGARSFRYGSVRAWVQELDVVLADGTTLTLSRDAAPDPAVLSGLADGVERDLDGSPVDWPRVRKNSSGYALDHYLRTGRALELVVGGEGTLACITGALLRIARAPEARGLALLRARGGEEIEAFVRSADATGASACEFFGRRFLEIAGIEEDPEVGFLARGAEALILIEVDGDADEVEDKLARLRTSAAQLGSGIRIARVREERERLWAIRHAASPIIARQAAQGLVSMQFIEDSVVPAQRLPRFLAAVVDILEGRELDAVIFGHAGDGNVHVNPLVDVRRPDWRERVRGVLEETAALVAQLGGTLTGEHGDGRVRAPFLTTIWSPELVQAFEGVKTAFDPLGILNPGVIIPVEGQDPLEGIGAAFREVEPGLP